MSEADDYVFKGVKGEDQLDPTYVSKRFKRYIRMSDLPNDYTFHSLRHMFCTWMIQAGVPVRVVKELAGHADVDATAARLVDEAGSALHALRCVGGPRQTRPLSRHRMVNALMQGRIGDLESAPGILWTTRRVERRNKHDKRPQGGRDGLERPHRSTPGCDGRQARDQGDPPDRRVHRGSLRTGMDRRPDPAQLSGHQFGGRSGVPALRWRVGECRASLFCRGVDSLSHAASG